MRAIVTPAEYLPRVNIVQSAQQASAGSLSSGIVLQGVNPGDRADLRWYTFSAGGGTNPDGSAVSKELGTLAWCFNLANWVNRGTASFGSATLAWRGNPRSESTLAFQTDADLIGIAGGRGNVAMSIDVYVDVLDGSGFKRLTPLPPLPATLASASTAYFSFASDDPNASALKKVIMILGANGPAGLCLPANATLAPYDATESSITMGVMADSIFATSIEIGRKLGVRATILSHDSGTGYAYPNNFQADGKPATSNANVDVTRSFTSAAGNIGYHPDSERGEGVLLVAPNPTARTDLVIAARPDVVLLAHGINDPAPDAPASFDFEAAFDLTMSRLRAGLPDAVLIVLSPWTSAQRGTSGLDGGAGSDTAKRDAMSARIDLIAGPWIFINNADSSWKGKRADGSTFWGFTGSGAWMRGNASTENRANDTTPPSAQPGNDANSNAGWVSYDGIHVAGLMASALAAPGAVSESFTMQLVSVARLPYSGTVSVQPAGGPLLDYANEILVTYARKHIGSNELRGCIARYPDGSPVPNGTELAPGSDVYSRSLSIVDVIGQPPATFANGQDFYATKAARAIADACAVL